MVLAVLQATAPPLQPRGHYPGVRARGHVPALQRPRLCDCVPVAARGHARRRLPSPPMNPDTGLAAGCASD